MKRKLLSVVMVLLLVMNLGMVVSAEDSKKTGVTNIIGRVEDYLMECTLNEFDPYYDIVECEITSTYGENINEIYSQVEVKIVLEAERVEDLESYQGMLAAVGITLTDEMKISQGTIQEALTKNSDTTRYADALSTYLSDMYENLNSYIGVEQEYVFLYKTILNDDEIDGFVVYCEDGVDYVRYTPNKARTNDTLYSQGYNMMAAQYERIVEDIDISKSMSAYNARSSSSNRNNALVYALAHTSEITDATACSICNSTTCGGKSNVSYYNLAYSYYHQNDCANFVSQCMYAGNFPVNSGSEWAPGSSTWISTQKLTEWMTSHMFWIESDKTSLIEGDVLSKVGGTGSNHVMIVTGYNGTHRLVSAHTNDRKNHIFNFESLEASGYKFYYVNYLNY